MADLPHVKKGEGDWTTPFNSLIDFRNAVGGVRRNALMTR